MRFFATWLFLIIANLFLIFIFASPVIATEASAIKNVVKVKTYQSRSDGSYVFTTYGSAIAISPTRILTNAHVIAPDGEPTGLYEVCLSNNFENVPTCREIARLIAYDTVADLAILELSHNNALTPFTLSRSKLAIGSYVSMYWYPSIWGETITRTDGKIAWFEQTMYKIDGNIDHGNSGGWALNSSGELVGIPTAVASDNASLGYMIPTERIQMFLSKRTNNYELYMGNIDRTFAIFLKRNQSYHTNKTLYKWNDLQVKNPRPYGFVLKNSIVSSDNRMLSWLFVDMYERVKLTLSCTDDAGGLLGWEARRDGFVEEQKSYPTWEMKATEDEKYLTIYSSSKWYNPGITLYYKNYDACFAEVEYLDAKKDAKSLEKIIKFLKKWVLFRSKYNLRDSQKNKYFEIPYTEKYTRVIRSIDFFGNESVLLGFSVLPGQWINASIEGKEYTTIDELWTALDIDFTTTKNWEQYTALLRESGVERSDISLINLDENKKAILLTHYDPTKMSTKLTFQYIYKTPSAQYAYWTWSANIKWERTIDLTRLKTIFTSFIYPGESILQ